MRRLIAALLVLTACGTSNAADLPTPPFGYPPTGDPVLFTVPIDTATTDRRPRNLINGTRVPAGDTRFEWAPIDGVDTYVLVVNEVSVPDGDPARVTFTPYARERTEGPAVDVSLVDPFDDGEPVVLIVQVFAYRDSEIVGASDAWTLRAGR